ncbi:MAG TPA: lysylphosphatidylglycerol synthase transmembrane domain-containing protein [Anaerolineales bacterium]|nr:lysylphosphatidylglycerol synthase transmembrane domain-containing protein [Anaerolineales bacterium]
MPTITRVEYTSEPIVQRQRWVYWLKWLASVLLLGWLSLGVDWRGLAYGLGKELHTLYRWQTLGWLGLYSALYGLSLWLKLVRWQNWLQQAGVNLPISQVRAAFLNGVALNIVGVARMGDVGRAAQLSWQAPHLLPVVSGTILREKLTDLLMLAGFTLTVWLGLYSAQLGQFSAGLTAQQYDLFRLGLLASVPVWYALGCVTLHPLGKWCQNMPFIPTWLKTVLGASLTLRAFAPLTWLIWLVMGVSNGVIFLSLQSPLSWAFALWLSCGVLVAGFLAVVVSVTPANVGTHHAAVIFFLQQSGLPLALALPYAVLAHLLPTVLPLLFAAINLPFHQPFARPNQKGSG